MTTAVRERPILFSAPMVRALLDGRKTQTRRVVKPTVFIEMEEGDAPPVYQSDPTFGAVLLKHGRCPYGVPGGRLFVRESLRRLGYAQWVYAADGAPVDTSPELQDAARTWIYGKNTDRCNSIHMPRWASRLTLDITDVRVQRVEDISEEDAIAEGFENRAAFMHLFYDINERAPRGSNPWVFAITFTRAHASPSAVVAPNPCAP